MTKLVVVGFMFMYWFGFTNLHPNPPPHFLSADILLKACFDTPDFYVLTDHTCYKLPRS